MDLNARQAAAGHHRVHDDSVADVHRDRPELFNGGSGEAGPHVHPHVRRAGEALAELKSRADALPCQLEGGPDKPGSLARHGDRNQVGLRSESERFESA